MRVLNPGWSAWPSCLDVFVSSKLMPRVDCPVLVMHVSDLILSSSRHPGCQHLSRWHSGQCRAHPELGSCLLQGTEDEVINIRHGKRLHELAKLKSQPLWAEGHNHQVGMQKIVCDRAPQPSTLRTT